MAREAREEIADPSPALAPLLKGPETLAVFSSDSRKGLLAEFRIELLPVHFLERRFVVPRVHVAEAARAEDLDYRLRTRREVRCARRSAGPFGAQQMRERHATDTARSPREEFTPGGR